MVYELSKQTSVLGTYMSEIRDIHIQRDAMRFRRNMERIAEIMAYEISKTLDYQEECITTPLGESICMIPKQQPVLATILRAGLSMHQGMLNVFDHAESAFISAYRKHYSPEKFEIYVEYMAAPSVDKQIVIISDPMLATGSSMELAYKALLKQGTPKKVHVCAAIAAPEAIEHLKRTLPNTVDIWVGAIDQELTSKSYIVPGLGDAGDLAYGEKL